MYYSPILVCGSYITPSTIKIKMYISDIYDNYWKKKKKESNSLLLLGSNDSK